MTTSTVKFKKTHPLAATPVAAHGYYEDAGADVKSIEHVILEPGDCTAIETGLEVEIPAGLEMQVRSRSGMALKSKVVVANSPGTVDPGYRGPVKVILFNAGTKPFVVNAGDKIAQVVVARYEAVNWEEQGTLASSERGTGGFGSSGQ